MTFHQPTVGTKTNTFHKMGSNQAIQGYHTETSQAPHAVLLASYDLQGQSFFVMPTGFASENAQINLTRFPVRAQRYANKISMAVKMNKTSRENLIARTNVGV